MYLQVSTGGQIQQHVFIYIYVCVCFVYIYNIYTQYNICFFPYSTAVYVYLHGLR